jgi:hypothetical protein
VGEPLIKSLAQPPCYSRQRRTDFWIYAASQVLLLTAGAWLAYRRTSALPLVARIVSPVVFTLAGSLVFVIIQRRKRKRLVGEAIMASYALCPECAYEVNRGDSSKEPMVRPCPECGAPVDVVKARELWKTWADANG